MKISPKLKTRRALMLGAAIMIIVIAVAAFLLRVDPDAGGKKGKEWSLDAGSGGVLAMSGNTLASASSTGLTIYSTDGDILLQELFSMQVPALACSDGLIAAWDVGGTELRIAKNDAVEQIELTHKLISVRANDSGWLSVTTQEPGQKGLVTVYDDSLTAVYAWYAGSGYPLTAQLSPDCKNLAILTASDSGAQLRFFRLDSEDEQGAYTAQDELLHDICWLNNSTVCALGSGRAVFLDSVGAEAASYDFGGLYLADYDFGSDFVVLALTEYISGSAARLVTLGSKGNELGSAELEGELLALDANDARVAALLADSVRIYSESLKPKDSCEVQNARDLFLRQRGDLLVIYLNWARPIL